MIRTVLENLLSYKMSGFALMTTAGAVAVDKWHWVDTSLPRVVAILGAVLTLVLIVGHIINLIWKNRRETEVSRKAEIDLEESNLKVEILKMELKERKERESEDNVSDNK